MCTTMCFGTNPANLKVLTIRTGNRSQHSCVSAWERHINKGSPPSTLLWCWALAAKRSTSSFFSSYAFGMVKARMMTAHPCRQSGMKVSAVAASGGSGFLPLGVATSMVHGLLLPKTKGNGGQCRMAVLCT